MVNRLTYVLPTQPDQPISKHIKSKWWVYIGRGHIGSRAYMPKKVFLKVGQEVGQVVQVVQEASND